jgi:DNA-binding transcriptional MerR regulator
MTKKIKSFGFTLNETDELLEMIGMNTASCSNVSQKLADKITVIDAKIQELMELKRIMQHILGSENSCCTPAITDQNCPSLIADILPLSQKD